MPTSVPRRKPYWIAALLGVASIAAAAPTAEAQGPARRNLSPVAAAVRKAKPSVVSISSEKKAASTSRWPFSAEESQRPRVNGMGTGVILDGRGYILTNHHVVDKVQGIEVHLSDGTSLIARVLQFDPVMDLAMLKVDPARPLPAIAIGTSADLAEGDDVITIGNAFGYEGTTSVGVISALGRNVTLSDDQVYRNLIQTDACINPGNSGGPLLNLDGELIGINVAVRAGAQGIGFALPIDDVKRVAAEMMSTRRLTSTWHGLVSRDVTGNDVRSVVLNEVQAGSPAESAGFRPGDQLLKVNDLAVTNPLDVERGLLDVPAGQPARVQIRRNGQDQDLALNLVPLPRAGLPAAADPSDQVWRLLGLKTSPVTNEYVTAASPGLRGGLYVQQVSPNSPAARGMIQRGDILVGINVGSKHWETLRADNVVYILRESEASGGQPLQFYIVRKNSLFQGALNLAGSAPAGSVTR